MESRPAENGHADEDAATGIQVDLDAKDSSKAVLRTRAHAANVTTSNRADRAAQWAENNRDVKRRINSMQRGFDQALANQQAEHQRQLAELNGKIDKLSTKGEPTGTDEAAHQAAMDKLQASLEEAQERGDSKDAAKITREMSALEGKYWAAKTAKQVGTNAREETAKPNVAAQPTGQRTASGYTKAGIAWAKANAGWWEDRFDPTARQARALANELHAQRTSEGFDPEDPQHFEAIRKEVAKRFPEIDTVSTVKGRRVGPGDDDDDDDDVRGQEPANRRGPASFPNRGGAPKGSDLQTLTRADLKTMREVGMNPDNDKHVLQFLASKREDAMADQDS